jgi:hypothetical protein
MRPGCSVIVSRQPGGTGPERNIDGAMVLLFCSNVAGLQPRLKAALSEIAERRVLRVSR